MLSSTTCVGFRYGTPHPGATRLVSGAAFPALSPRPRPRGTVPPQQAPRASQRRLYLRASTRHSVGGRRFRSSVPASQLQGARECSPVTRRAALHRQGALRTRLTLIRLALIRNPWSSGVGVSRPHCRYSCLHLPFRALHRASRRGFEARGMLPYRRRNAAPRLRRPPYARSSSTPARSTGELLRTL